MDAALGIFVLDARVAYVFFEVLLAEVEAQVRAVNLSFARQCIINHHLFYLFLEGSHKLLVDGYQLSFKVKTIILLCHAFIKKLLQLILIQVVQS